jgi:hypothetical protein
MEATNASVPIELSRSSYWDLLSRLIPLSFGSVVGANILTMSLMNFIESTTTSAPTIYLCFLVLTGAMMLLCRIPYPLLSRGEHLFCISIALLFFLPRFPYLIEGLLGYALIPIGDDAFHIPYMAAVIHTGRFPPLSNYDSHQYLAYYYAAWMPGAAIYHAGWVSTVKQALGLVKLMYCFFMAYFPVYASKVLFTEAKLRRMFLVLCYLYGGFDFIYWLSGLSIVPSHSEWWALDFGLALQFSNFITLALWTPQHLLAALAILFGMYVIGNSKGIASSSLVGLFFLSAVFSSPFVVLGAIPFVLWYFTRIHRLWSTPVTGIVFAVVSLPLWWILVGNDSIGFQPFGALWDPMWLEPAVWSGHKRAAFLVFLLVVFLELGLLIVASALFALREKKARWPFCIAGAFLLSTFFFYYDVNYSMRGAIVPIFVLTYLATPVVAKWLQERQPGWLYPILFLYLLGGVLEYASHVRGAVVAFGLSNTAFNVEALRSNRDPGRFVSKALQDEAGQHPLGWELLEKYKPERKSPLPLMQSRLMHPDNPYRVTWRRTMTLRNHAER